MSAGSPPQTRHHLATLSPEAERPSEQHKRVYQACIPCRRRKVKCDLGSVDNPSDPPCVRCRRESKECYFSATRRKRKADDGLGESLDGYEPDDYVQRNRRKTLHAESSPLEHAQSLTSASAPTTATFADPASSKGVGGPLTPGGSLGQMHPLRRPELGGDDANANEALENLEAQQVMSREVFGPHDALDLLYRAATDDHANASHRPRASSLQLPPILGLPVTTQHQTLSPLRRNTNPVTVNSRRPEVLVNTSIDPALAAQQTKDQERLSDAGYKEGIKAWARFKFVRAGWFSPGEAIEYIDYYYKYLSPLTPISPNTFQQPSTHLTLLNEEPILTITLLTIASRYHRLAGTGGQCRSNAIHEQLWTYLRGMIERCLWGQEAFGNGFYMGSVATGRPEMQSSTTAPERGLRKGSLRTLGTVESLMILTEWHPRSLHFPPADATDELMLPSYNVHDAYSTDDEGGHRPPAGLGGRRVESWLEPAWRSDRMCWMLLSNAMGLSYELGVFDDIEDSTLSCDISRPEYQDEEYRLRAARIKRLLLIYVTQLSGRLGWTNMVPENLRNNAGFTVSRRRRMSTDGRTPDTSTTSSAPFTYIPNLELDDTIIHCCAGISNAMRIGNEKLFKSRSHTSRIIQDGTYLDLLKDFQPMLRNWKKEFDRYDLPMYIRHILQIEYEYVRIYINSLSLQSVVERCNAKSGGLLTTSRPAGASGPAETLVMSPETQNYYSKMPLTKLGGFGAADQLYVKEVIEGSRSLMRIVVDGLLPNGYLKHAPVRTYFHIVSGAMFLLKTFALGATRHDVEVSIGLIDAAVDALRTCVVDDVHLGTRFADLLMSLTSRLRSRFISAPQGLPPGGESRQPSGMNSPDLRRQKLEPRDIHEWNAQTPQYTNGASTDPNAPLTPTQHIFYPPFPQPVTPGGSNTYASSNGNDNTNAFTNAGDWSSTDQMWYLPPGATFFQNVNDQAITQTAEGVQVGGYDLLDYMVESYAGAGDGIF